MMSMNRGRYRLRTWLRGRLPVVLTELVPKGARDCGDHEWYRADEQSWRCYHCEPAVASSSPWTQEEHLQHTLGGIDSTLRVLALAALPEEEHRLERLAATPAAELPGLVQALHAG